MQLNVIYTASLDGTAKIITATVVLLSIVLCYAGIRGLRKSKGDIMAISLNLFIVLLAVFITGGTFLCSPRNYILGNFDIAVDRPVGRVTIQVKDILEIRPIRESEMEGITRVFGVGGLFGYYGHYYGRNLGDMTWYATNRNNLVIIHTKEGDAIVISPDDKDFVGRILAKKADL